MKPRDNKSKKLQNLVQQLKKKVDAHTHTTLLKTHKNMAKLEIESREYE